MGTLERAIAALGTLLVVVTVVVVIGHVAGEDDEPTQAAAPAGAKPGAIAIKDFKYLPAETTVPAGTKLTISNQDVAPHTVTSEEKGAFDTGTFDGGAKATVTLKKAGTYKYFCELHAFMRGTVTVR